MAEFVLALPLLVLMLFGMIEFGRAFNANVTLSHAAREGAREYAISADATAARAVVDASLDPLDPADVSMTPPGGCTPGDPVTITLTHAFNYNVPFLPGTTINLSSSGVMRCE